MRCFISHPWANHIHHFALRLTKELRAHNVKVWIDEEQIGAGQNFMTRQLNGVQYETDIFLLILSHETIQSISCMKELETALRVGKPVISIMLEQCEIPHILSESITVDFTNPVYFDASVTHLLAGAEIVHRLYKVADILNDDDPEKRTEAARLLGDIHDPRILKALLVRLEVERDETVKHSLLSALGDLINPNKEDGQVALQVLKIFSKSETRFSRRGATEAFKKLRLRYPDINID